MRLRNINLRMILRKLESQLRSKEQLAEGLHLIDFEQLKIENQTLNEKIEERNEELHKLRKKNTSNVQVCLSVSPTSDAETPLGNSPVVCPRDPAAHRDLTESIH